MLIAVGLRASVQVVVSESDTAAALRSGDVPVLGTPRLLAPGPRPRSRRWLRARRIPAPGHPAPRPPEDPPPGARPSEDPSADEDEHVVGAGTIERVVVARERFLACAYSRPSGASAAPPAARIARTRSFVNTKDLAYQMARILRDHEIGSRRERDGGVRRA
jgi:fluoroacetyl-CoA thioesterase